MLKNPPPHKMQQNRLISAKDKNIDLKKQVSNKSGDNNQKQSDKLVGKILESQDKNIKQPEIKKENRNEFSNNSNSDLTGSTEPNSENNNIMKKRESEKKDLKNIENFFEKKKENLNR